MKQDNHSHDIPPKKIKRHWSDWLPLGVVVSFIILLTFLAMSITATTVDNFLTLSMGYFFTLFSLFKLLDLRAFVAGYREYDLVSKAWPSWAYLYPFLELWLGALYLSDNASLPVHVVTIIISLLTCLSVGLSMRKKQSLHCACLGTILKVPLTTISIAEYALMALMAVFMLTVANTTTQPSALRVYDQYAQLYGEAYDKEFLHEMVDHHEGAIAMAAIVTSRTAHQELTEFAQAIDTAQQTEIQQMKSWQTSWNYQETHMHEDTSMHDHMSEMTDTLKDLTANEFDSRFLELMIEHHQSAIDMAISGTTNAAHDELRNLSQKIVLDQTKEIAQMRQWQSDWGYVN